MEKERNIKSKQNQQRKLFNSTTPKIQVKSRNKSQGNIQIASPKNMHSNSKQNVQREKSNSLMESGPIRGNDCQRQLQQRLNQLNQKRDKMYACIDLFNLMQSNSLQLRCMQHNNTLSLYCLTERRILCVNCIFGITKHRTHKIMPLRDSENYINEDNQVLKEILNKDLKILDQSIKNSQQNSMILEKELKKNLQILEFVFHKQIEELTNKYKQQVINIKECYSNVINKSKQLEKNVQQFKFKVWETLSKIGIGKGQKGKNSDMEVIKQVFCVSLSELTHLEVKKLTRYQIQKLNQKFNKFG